MTSPRPLSENEATRGAAHGRLTHLYIGEEAVAVGVCSALRVDDVITSTHRGYGHCIAKGADARRMFCELLGKEERYCRGKGGSMHIADHAGAQHSQSLHAWVAHVPGAGAGRRTLRYRSTCS